MVSLKLDIDASFFSSEERDGFFVSAAMKRVWAVELDLLNEFSTVCDRHGLKWFVHAGTMLGAVRHHGFIPWDDDIDVVMPRDDYERLCALGPSEFSHPYFFQNEYTDRFFARNFSRLRNSETTAIIERERVFNYPFNQGIFIDIFPMDHIPGDPEERKVFYEELADLNAHSFAWRRMIHFYRPQKGQGVFPRAKYFLKHLYFKYLSKRGYRFYRDKHRELITKYNNMDTGWVGESVINPLGRQLWRPEWVQSTISVPFEMIRVPVPDHYEECLTASFGKDWRTPKHIPTLHGDVVFDTEKPYTSYLNIK